MTLSVFASAKVLEKLSLLKLNRSELLEPFYCIGMIGIEPKQGNEI
jgi:hypothetical protein